MAVVSKIRLRQTPVRGDGLVTKEEFVRFYNEGMPWSAVDFGRGVNVMMQHGRYLQRNQQKEHQESEFRRYSDMVPSPLRREPVHPYERNRREFVPEALLETMFEMRSLTGIINSPGQKGDRIDASRAQTGFEEAHAASETLRSMLSRFQEEEDPLASSERKARLVM